MIFPYCSIISNIGYVSLVPTLLVLFIVCFTILRVSMWIFSTATFLSFVFVFMFAFMWMWMCFYPCKYSWCYPLYTYLSRLQSSCRISSICTIFPIPSPTTLTSLFLFSTNSITTCSSCSSHHIPSLSTSESSNRFCTILASNPTRKVFHYCPCSTSSSLHDGLSISSCLYLFYYFLSALLPSTLIIVCFSPQHFPIAFQKKFCFSSTGWLPL